MSGILRFVLGLSLAGGATSLAVFAAALSFKKLVKQSWLFYIWLVALLRFIIPLPLNLPFISDGLSTVAAAISAAAEPQQLPALGSDPAQGAPGSTASLDANWAAAGNHASADGGKAAAGKTLPPVSGTASVPISPVYALIGTYALRLLPYVWPLGASLLLIHTIVGYTLTLRRLHGDRTLLTPGRVPIYESGQITTPILVGLFRPAVYLPVGFPHPGLAVCHEMTHFKRGDIWLKWLLQLTVCVHWLNPLAWLMKRELNRLCELSCDSAVLRRLDTSERHGYGQMLLDTARRMADHSGALVASLGKDKRLLKERLGELVSDKKTTKKTVAAMSVLSAVILSAAVVFGALFTGCTANSGTATVQTTPKTDSSATVPDAAPGASPEQTTAATPSTSVSAYPDVSLASPSGSAVFSKVLVIVTSKIDDLPFDNDPAIIGTWLPVGKADSVSSFIPEKTPSDAANTWELIIDKDAQGSYAYYTQYKGYQTQDYPDWALAVSYEIKEIEGKTYLFIEEKSSGGQTSYLVFEQLSAATPSHTTSSNIPGSIIIVTTPSETGK